MRRASGRRAAANGCRAVTAASARARRGGWRLPRPTGDASGGCESIGKATSDRIGVISGGSYGVSRPIKGQAAALEGASVSASERPDRCAREARQCRLRRRRGRRGRYTRRDGSSSSLTADLARVVVDLGRVRWGDGGGITAAGRRGSAAPGTEQGRGEGGGRRGRRGSAADGNGAEQQRGRRRSGRESTRETGRAPWFAGVADASRREQPGERLP